MFWLKFVLIAPHTSINRDHIRSGICFIGSQFLKAMNDVLAYTWNSRDFIAKVCGNAHLTANVDFVVSYAN